ncbi:hypothetical protein ID866_9610 [Astraeus odoratus]|nr:hypothetical protein ID866_9610 [Astraeus odoratus]
MTDGWWEICTSCWVRNPSQRPRMSDMQLFTGTCSCDAKP